MESTRFAVGSRVRAKEDMTNGFGIVLVPMGTHGIIEEILNPSAVLNYKVLFSNEYDSRSFFAFDWELEAEPS